MHHVLSQDTPAARACPADWFCLDAGAEGAPALRFTDDDIGFPPPNNLSRDFYSLSRKRFAIPGAEVQGVQKKLGPLIKQARLAAKLTLAQLADRSNMSAGQISWIENGKRENPGFLTLIPIIRALGISFDTLADELSGVKAAPDDMTTMREVEAAALDAEKVSMRLRGILEKQSMAAQKPRRTKNS
jgi:transcriptional regulator with XRE-family HTH domain